MHTCVNIPNDGCSVVCVVVLGCEELAGAAAASVTGTVENRYETPI